MLLVFGREKERITVFKAADIRRSDFVVRWNNGVVECYGHRRLLRQPSLIVKYARGAWSP